MDERTRKCIALASKWYSKDNLAHAMRVADYAMEEATIMGFFKEEIEEIFQVAILHDILEDTECPKNEALNLLKYTIPRGALERLTKKPEETYPEYILRLSRKEMWRENTGDDSLRKILAYSLIIKRADMKDHLSLEETLTDKLKKKYYPVMKELL